MSVANRAAALCLAAVFFAAAPAFTLVKPGIYGSMTVYGGVGKAPKTGAAGLIIDGDTTGLNFYCFSFQISTEAKIKGHVSGTVERITERGIERLATFGKTKIQGLPVGQPPPSDNPCAPDLPAFEGNIGVATDCVEVMTPLEEGDFLRWLFRFKAPKLTGPNASSTIFVTVMPMGDFAAETADVATAQKWMRALSLELRDP